MVNYQLTAPADTLKSSLILQRFWVRSALSRVFQRTDSLQALPTDPDVTDWENIIQLSAAEAIKTPDSFGRVALSLWLDTSHD